MTALPPHVERILADYYDRGGTIEKVLDDEEELLLAAALQELRLLNGRADFIPGASVDGRIGGSQFTAQNWDVTETDALDGVDPGGTVTLSPGDDEPLARVEPTRDEAALLAVGAKDQTDVVYYLKIDGDRHHDPTNTPLGTIGSPYHFTDHGGYIPFGASAEYRAHYLDDSNGGDVEIGARLIHYEP